MTVSVLFGRIAPFMTSAQLPAVRMVFIKSPAACINSIGNSRCPILNSWNRIDIPSMDTRSKGGKSRSAETASASTRLTEVSRETDSIIGLTSLEKIISSASVTLTMYLFNLRSPILVIIPKESLVKSMSKKQFTHISKDGNPQMVNVSEKKITTRIAMAQAIVDVGDEI